MSKVLKVVAAVVAVAAAVVLTGGTALGAVASTIGRALVTAAVSIGISRLIAKRANTDASAGADAGGRVQLPPATSNKLPVVYGTAFIGGSITDAMLSTDQKTMWYVIAIAEHSDDQGGGAGGYTFDQNKIYYDGKQVQFGSNGAVTGLITNTSTPQIDTRCNGYLYIYLFPNGSSNCVNYAGQTAQTILSTSNGVPAAQAWTSGQAMTNCAFAIVKVVYSTDAGTTGAGQLMVNITNSITKPGDAILDYMLNTRYGCGLPIASIDTTSLTALNTYSDQLITYVPVGGGTATQNRYRINGPMDTGQNCLNNLQFLVDSCDSWLQYSELTGKWRVVMNKGYAQTPNAQTLNDLFLVDSSNLIGGIEVSPIDLNETYNQIEVAYPNTNIKDQTDYQIIDLFEDDPQILSVNEAINRLNVTLPLVNNAVQARYLASRRIYQSREDLTITFRLDFSGIQIEAGDVIRVTHEVYGWTDKLFRVSGVAEEKDNTGNLFAVVQAFEYSNDIYADIIEDYVPAFNTGLSDPNVISQPGTPVITNFTDANALVTGFNVTSTSPANGIVLYMDFNYGTSSNVLQHRLYRTVQQSDSTPYTANTNVTIPVNDLAAGNYYWSTTARNNNSGKRSNASAVLNWAGANIQPYNPMSNTGGITGNQVQYNTIVNNNIVNQTITGSKIANNTLVFPLFAPNLNVADLLGSSKFDIWNGSFVTLPINVTSRVNFNVPFYIIGTNPGTSYYSPWYQGTSTTANGYYDNSSGVWQPADAAPWERADGDWNWRVVTDVNLTTPVPTPIGTKFNILVTMVSNVDANVQFATVVGNNLYTTAYSGNDDTLTTINLTANQSYVWESVQTKFVSADVDYAGVMMRNMTTGANVTVISCQLGISKSNL